MAIGNNFRTFVNGLRLKPIDSQQNPQDETGIDVEGLLYIYADKMKIYVEAAIREVVTADQIQTLTNKTLTSPKINEDIELTATATELNQLDGVSVGGSSAGDIATIDGTQTLTNKTLTSPNVNEAVALTATSTDLNQLTGATLITPDSTTTFTNKIIDADSNTITNIDNDEIKAAAGIVESKLALDYPTNDLNTDIGTNATNISDHISDTTDAHAGSAITNTPAGNLAATDVQGALNELQTDVDTRAVDSSVVHLAGTETITGVKTFDENLIVKEQSSTTTPASGHQKIYPKTDGKWYTKDDVGTETEIGAGGGAGGINYLEDDNANAEVTVGDWLAYADAAGTRPVDGTGGTPTTTFTRTTTDPLRGDGSFLLTKDEANRQGEGASCPFTIDNADKGEIVGFSFDMEDSANFATEDIVCFAYDITNSNVISVNAGIGLQAGTGRFSGSFQAAIDSTSYRIIVHIASTNALAYTLKLDNLQIGPDAAGDTVDTTAMVRLHTGNGHGSTNNKIRRFTTVVDNFGSAITYADSATLGASFTIEEEGIYSMSLSDGSTTSSAPLGFSLNSTQLTTSIAAISADDRLSVAYAPSASLSNSASWSGKLTKGDIIRAHTGGNTDYSTGATFTIAKVSSASASASSGREIYSKVNKNATQTLTPAATELQLTFQAKLQDLTNSWDTSANSFTAPEDGNYNLNLQLTGSNPSTSQTAYLVTYKNGSEFSGGGKIYKNLTDTGLFSVVGVFTLFNLSKGDVITLHMRTSSSADVILYGSDSIGGGSQITFNKLNTAQQTNQSEVKVYVSAYNDAGTSVTGAGTATDIPWTETRDSHGAFDGTIFTAPYDMILRVVGSIGVVDPAATTNIVYISASVTSMDDSTQTINRRKHVTIADNSINSLEISHTLFLDKGQRVKIQFDASYTGTGTVPYLFAAQNWNQLIMEGEAL